ncbi:hypothetical protein ACOMHN_046444 [Nucella lapillus]
MGCGGSKSAEVTLKSQHAPTPSNQEQTFELPPLAHPRKCRDELIPDPSVFNEVDEYVRQVSKTPASSVEELAKALTTKYSDEMLKTRALFYWMALNIRFDTESYFSGDFGPQDASSVLQSRRAVCQGFSQLFDELCKVVKIPCLMVSGIAKGYRHDPEDVYTEHTKANHAWNLVLLQGEWRPLDSTWGTGHVNRSGRFVRRLEDRWFLTDPGEFVLRHFPLMDGDLQESAKYQSLPNPMTIEQFSAHVKLERDAHALGLQCLTHQQTVIDVIRDVTIKVKADKQPLESVKVTLEERAPVDQVKASHDVLTSLDDAGTCTIYVRPSRAATYLLKVFGRGLDQDGNKLHCLLTYVIRCKETHTNVDPYPDKHDLWGLHNPTATQCGIRLGDKSPSSHPNTPFLYTAKNSQATVPIHFSTDVTLKTHFKHARDKDNDLGKFTFIEYTEDGARITTRMPERGYYLLRLFSSHPSKKMLHPVVDFLLFSDRESPCRPFPQAFSAAFKERAQLLAPLFREVPGDESTVYRVKAPSVSELTVAGRRMELKNDDVWEAEVTPPRGKSDVTIYGAVDKDASSLSGLFRFSVAGR